MRVDRYKYIIDEWIDNGWMGRKMIEDTLIDRLIIDGSINDDDDR